MGQPVVHFEVIGKDGDKLRSYYSELFGWEIDSNNRCTTGWWLVRGILRRTDRVSVAE